MKNKPLILGVLLAVVGTSSAGAGGEGIAGQPASFQAGKTKAYDVEQALGRPNSAKSDAKGQEVACYQYALVSPEADTFIRMDGKPVAGADLTCCFRFMPGGVLADTTSNVGQRGGGDATAAEGQSGKGQPQKPGCPPALARFDKPVSTRIGN